MWTDKRAESEPRGPDQIDRGRRTIFERGCPRPRSTAPRIRTAQVGREYEVELGFAIRSPSTACDLGSAWIVRKRVTPQIRYASGVRYVRPFPVPVFRKVLASTGGGRKETQRMGEEVKIDAICA